jgi:phosphate acetyltransferase
MRAHRPVFDRVIEKCRDLDPIAVAVVSPLSEVALTGEMEAARAGLINPYFVGPRARIASLAVEHGIDIAPLLYHQTSWHRHGTSHQPLHRGIARRPLVGYR